ncbi:hybrid sensor histidine kinase/response regulator [Dyella tabacisoli]|uniref:histidine kinase n=1 Tax=Dyella tabacisoli TaxID=2282381 RepID=A0A369URE8_9GAMM|nr:hybrid sensor histidine kinase/response regulator [Dyella tabacisoli]RDD82873.1 response regulator [Dyella tabacisoli]
MLLGYCLTLALALAAPSVVAPASAIVPVAVSAKPLPTPQFRRYGTVNGLPSSNVQAAVQALDGAMWFGTDSGIARFDGVEFKVFAHVADDPGSLYGNDISSLLVDRHGQLWAGGVEAGLNRYDAMRGTFDHWGHDPADPSSLTSDAVWALASTADGYLWVGTSKGLDRMRADGHGFEHMSNTLLGDDPAAYGTVTSLYVDPQQRLWIASDNGVFRRDTDGQMHRVPQEGFALPIDFWSIDGDGDEVRIGAARGLLSVGKDGVARPVAPDRIPDTNVLSSIRDHAGRLWIGTRRGLFLQKSPTEPVIAVVNQPVLNGNLPGVAIWKIFSDREGGLWIALLDGGLAYLAPDWNNFSRFTHIPDDADSLRDSVATATAPSSDGKLWVGARAGRVDKLDPATGKVEHVLTLPRTDVASLLEDIPQRLWINMQGQLYRYAGGKLDKADPDLSHMQYPLEVKAGPGGKLYVRTNGEGIFRVDPDTLAVTPVPIEPANEKAKTGSQLGLNNGLLWYASNNGMLRLNARLDRFEPVRGMPGGRAVDAFDFNDDGLWIARSDGLEHYRYQGDGVVLDRRVDAAQGWPSVVASNLAVDSQGQVWIFVRNSLWRFDTESGRFNSLGLKDGLTSAEFVAGLSRMANGDIYGATVGGVFGFNPDRIQAHGAMPSLAIVGVSLRRKGVLRTQSLHEPIIQMGWQDRNLMIEARVFSYVNPAANRYRFRLNGFDADWVDSGNLGVRELTGLDHGDYTLDVMAAGADGVWGQLSTPLKIHVQAPPWARWWAWCTYALLASLLTWLTLRAWRRRLAQRHLVQLAEQRSTLAEQASAAKTQFLATLSHEIRTPMTGVLGMAELLLTTPLSPTQQEYTETMQRSGGLLLKLLNDALDLARIEAGRFELEPGPFDPRTLIHDVAQLERGVAQTKGLRFDVDIVGELPLWLLGDVVRIKQILLNLASNALKFTERGGVIVRARWYDDSESLLVSVCDTGLGIPEASQARLFQRFEQEDGPQRQAGSGLGLAICRELVGLMGGSIELESRIGHGSTFHVRLPLTKPSISPARTGRPTHTATAYTLRLLLVEDDMTVAAVICGLLKQQGHEVRHVVNGLSALAELAQDPFDAMLLDLDLPGVDGFQVARLVRQRETDNEHIPIIAVTARSGGDEDVRAREAGMDGLLRKPLTGEQLANVLRGIAVAA